MNITPPPNKQNKISPEKWWLEDDPFLLKWPLFRGHVSFPGGVDAEFLECFLHFFFLMLVASPELESCTAADCKNGSSNI